MGVECTDIVQKKGMGMLIHSSMSMLIWRLITAYAYVFINSHHARTINRRLARLAARCAEFLFLVVMRVFFCFWWLFLSYRSAALHLPLSWCSYVCVRLRPLIALKFAMRAWQTSLMIFIHSCRNSRCMVVGHRRCGGHCCCSNRIDHCHSCCGRKKMQKNRFKSNAWQIKNKSPARLRCRGRTQPSKRSRDILTYFESVEVGTDNLIVWVLGLY